MLVLFGQLVLVSIFSFLLGFIIAELNTISKKLSTAIKDVQHLQSDVIRLSEKIEKKEVDEK